VERAERVERSATRLSAVLLLLLCIYLLGTTIAGLVSRPEPRQSWAGLAISAAAVIVMPLLAWRKRVANRTIQSSALRADIAETITCAYMAGATLVGVALSTTVGWWWAEYVAAFALLFFIAREAREALEAARHSRVRCEDG
jgi:divalent metal cation (Fe/Co/Zn/Cd) transporter